MKIIIEVSPGESLIAEEKLKAGIVNLDKWESGKEKLRYNLRYFTEENVCIQK